MTSKKQFCGLNIATMKTAIFFLLLLTMVQPTFAQTGIGTTTPAFSAALDVSSTTKGFLPPRMSWAQIQAISLPTPGLTVYDNNINALRVYTPRGWTVLSPKAQGFYDPPGNFSSTTQTAGSGTVLALSVKNSRLNPANAYVLGYFSGTSIIGGQILITSASFSTFFAKFDSTGTALWVKVLGSNSTSLPWAMELDLNDNIYIGGQFFGTMDFDPGAGVANLTPSGTSDAFYARYDANGNYKWAKGVGGTGPSETVSAITCNGSNVYVAGIFNGSGFFNGATLSGGGSFIGKYDTSTGNLSGQDWVKQISGTSYFQVNAIRATATAVYVGGIFSGSVTLPGGVTKTTTSNQASFVDILDQTGTTQSAPVLDAGGSYVTSLDYITTDASGNIYLCGFYGGSPNLDMSGATYVAAPLATTQGAAYILKWTATTGYPLAWSATISGTGSVYASRIAVDASNNVTMSGHTTGPITFGNGITIPAEGSDDLLLARYNSSGALQWIKNAGSSGGDYSGGVDVSPNGKVIWSVGQMAASPFLDFNSTKVSASGFFLSRYEE